MQKLAAFVGAAVGLACSTAAAHDRVWASRSDRLVERAHTIDATVGYADAVLRVRRTVHNGGERHDQAVFHLDLPMEAVATGLRTLGELRGKPHWFPGDLLEAEYAAERYRELTGIGGYYPKDPALLSWRRQGHLALQVFPVAPNRTKTVEYTMRVPVSYYEGQYRFELAALGSEDSPALVTIAPAERRDQLFIDGDPVGRFRTIRAHEAHEITLARHDAPLLDTRLASIDAGDRHVVQYQLALSKRVAEVPRHAGVVVVLDTSRSLSPPEVEAAVGAAHSYLEHFEGRSAQAEVLTFDRRVRRRHGRLRPVREVMADLRGLDPSRRGNGSALDDALATATKILAKQPRSVPKRIVVITDGRTAQRLTPARLAAITSRADAVIHIGMIDNGSPSLVRDDAHPWAEAARLTGGLVWSASALGPAESSADDQREVYLEWARPVRLDRVEAQATGTFAGDIALPENLDEGFGMQTLGLYADGVGRVVVTGELWSRSVREVAVIDDDHSDLWSALVFGSDVLHDLGEEEMMVLAMRGRAVSPVTSYLAIEPGVRPSTEGLDDIELSGVGGGGTGVGTFGLGSVGTIGHGGPPIDPQAFLEERAEVARAACGVGASNALEVQLQTTKAEIVEVDRVSLGKGTDAVDAACIEDQIWSVELPSVFTAAWKRWTVSV